MDLAVNIKIVSCEKLEDVPVPVTRFSVYVLSLNLAWV